MVRTDPITNSKIALTNIIKPKDSSLRQNSMWTRTLNALQRLQAASRNHAASAAAAAPSAGGFPNGSPATHLHDQH